MMNKEIGGYFEFGDLIQKPYHVNCYQINCARNCLKLLVKKREIKKIYVPNYLCDSVFEALNEVDCSYEKYDIDITFKPRLAVKLKEHEFIYIVNYFGQLNNTYLTELKEKYKNIIVDNAQSFFQKPLNKIDTIYTCRKYFGVPDGAYLYTDMDLENNLKIDKSSKRMNHLLGRCEKNANEYYGDFKKNEEYFDTCDIKEMSKIASIILGAIDYDNVINIRNRNFKYLNNELSALNLIEVSMNNGPFSYPFYTNKGLQLRTALIENNIFIATLWPNTLSQQSLNEITKNLISIPCDQRYGINDMNKITKIIKEILK